MVMQQWHLGRAAALTGFDVVSASDIALPGLATPRPMTVDEIAATVKDYATAAKNFVEGAGGDGIELHSANGYCSSSLYSPPVSFSHSTSLVSPLRPAW